MPRPRGRFADRDRCERVEANVCPGTPRIPLRVHWQPALEIGRQRIMIGSWTRQAWQLLSGGGQKYLHRNRSHSAASSRAPEEVGNSAMQSTAGGDAWTSRSKTPRAEQRLIEGPRSCAGVLLMPNWQASADRGEIRTRLRGWPTNRAAVASPLAGNNSRTIVATNGPGHRARKKVMKVIASRSIAFRSRANNAPHETTDIGNEQSPLFTLSNASERSGKHKPTAADRGGRRPASTAWEAPSPVGYAAQGRRRAARGRAASALRRRSERTTPPLVGLMPCSDARSAPLATERPGDRIAVGNPRDCSAQTPLERWPL
jgi:hypothetical protein